jgi:hypothetical protein
MPDAGVPALALPDVARHRASRDIRSPGTATASVTNRPTPSLPSNASSIFPLQVTPWTTDQRSRKFGSLAEQPWVDPEHRQVPVLGDVDDFMAALTS